MRWNRAVCLNAKTPRRQEGKTLQIQSIARYWALLRKSTSGLWFHPEDEQVFSDHSHTFNLDFPPPAFVGDVINAKVIVLTANGGYDPAVTPAEFAHRNAEQEYVSRLASPDTPKWDFVAPYYSKINYGHYIPSGVLATVNACAYRSPKISQERDNSKLVRHLPSVQFNRTWLLDIILPLVKEQKRLVIAKRPKLWDLPKEAIESGLVLVDKTPASQHLNRNLLQKLREFVEG